MEDDYHYTAVESSLYQQSNLVRNRPIVSCSTQMSGHSSKLT